MQAELATKYATPNARFIISFDKKALREQALSAGVAFDNLRQSLMHPLMLMPLKSLWRTELVKACASFVRKPGLSTHVNKMNMLLDCIDSYAQVTSADTPLISIELLRRCGEILGEHVNESEKLNAWIDWINGSDCLQLAPIYRALLAIYYIQIVHPFGAYQACFNMALLTLLLRCAGFKDVAEGVVYYFCRDEYRLTKVFIATQKSQHLINFQTQWIKYYLTNIQEFLQETHIYMYKKYHHALFDQARYSYELNERQAAIVDQLILDKTLRNKKILYQSHFYRALYHKQSRRTQERDFKAICDLKLIIMKDAQSFDLVIDLY